MGQTITFAKGGYVHAETADQDISAVVREVLASALDKFPSAELVGEPRIELSEDVENIPEETRTRAASGQCAPGITAGISCMWT